MWNIVKHEFEYHRPIMLFVVFLPILYSAAVYGLVELLSIQNITARVIYPIFAGAAPTVIIGVAWINSRKERREYMFHKLPVTLNGIIVAKILSVLIPLGFVLLYNYVINFLIADVWQEITKRVIYQIGIMTLILSNLLIITEILERNLNWNDTTKIITGAFYFSGLLSLMFLSDNILFPVMNQAYIGIIYTFIGVGFFFIGIKIYSERKIFTS